MSVNTLNNETTKFSHGIYLDSIDKLNNFIEDDFMSSEVIDDIMIAGCLLDDDCFGQKLISFLEDRETPVNIIVKEPLPNRMVKLMATQNDKMKLDFLQVFSENLDHASKFGTAKILQSFDILSLEGEGKEFFNSLCGIAWAKNIKFDLSLRIPMLNNDNDLLRVHTLLRKSMWYMNLNLDIHIDENGFLQMDFAEVIKPVIFDISSIHFLYESQFGNRLDMAIVERVSQICRQFNPKLKVFF